MLYATIKIKIMSSRIAHQPRANQQKMKEKKNKYDGL